MRLLVSERTFYPQSIGQRFYMCDCISYTDACEAACSMNGSIWTLKNSLREKFGPILDERWEGRRYCCFKLKFNGM